jgi:hypothetical protein
MPVHGWSAPLSEPERRAPARLVEKKAVRAERELGAPIAVQGFNAPIHLGEISPRAALRGEKNTDLCYAF